MPTAPCAPGTATPPPASILNHKGPWPLPVTGQRVHQDHSAATCHHSLHSGHTWACQRHCSPSRRPLHQALPANLSGFTFSTHPELATSLPSLPPWSKQSLCFYLEYRLLVSLPVCLGSLAVCSLFSSQNELVPCSVFHLTQEKPTLARVHLARPPCAGWHPVFPALSFSLSSLLQVPSPTISSCSPLSHHHQTHSLLAWTLFRTCCHGALSHLLPTLAQTARAL